MDLKIGSKVEFNVGTGGTVWTGVIKSMHDNHEYIEVSANGLIMCLPKSILRVVDEDQSEPEYPDLEPDFNKLERQENARLDALENEAELKAYYAEHGDDAPDPAPIDLGKKMLTPQHAAFLLKIIREKGDIECLAEEDYLFFQLRDLNMVKWDDDEELYFVLPEGRQWLNKTTASAILEAVWSARANINNAPDSTPLAGHWHYSIVKRANGNETTLFRTNNADAVTQAIKDDLCELFPLSRFEIQNAITTLADWEHSALVQHGIEYIRVFDENPDSDELLDVVTQLAAVTAERDALKAENERLRDVLKEVHDKVIQERLADDQTPSVFDLLVYIESEADRALNPKNWFEAE